MIMRAVDRMFSRDGNRYAGLLSIRLAKNADFNESYLIADPVDHWSWNDFSKRVQRYRVLWAFYEGTVYSSKHPWALNFRKAFGMYAWVRQVISRFHEIGEFHAQHIQGGELDEDAGDGKSKSSCLPVIIGKRATEVDVELRACIARVWLWSRWKVYKDIFGRTGGVKGDVALKVEDDAEKSQVRICVVQPETIKWIDRDSVGNIKGYVIQEERLDPTWDYAQYLGSEPPYRTYTEVCRREWRPEIGDHVLIYETYLDGEEYDWRSYDDDEQEVGWTWEVPYGFVPLFVVQHIHVGFDWGWSEFHATLARNREGDDLASCVTDQVRKQLNGPWAVNSRRPSDLTDNKEKAANDEMAAQSQSNVQGRDRLEIKWIDKDNLKIQHMVGDMNIDGVIRYLDRIQAVIEKDHPELAADAGSLSGDVSGRALRTTRQKAVKKINVRRAAYDEALVRAHQAAITIAAVRGYEPDIFGRFDESSYDDGLLDHQIGKRPVFEVDPMDDLELEKALWDAALSAVNAGLPLLIFLEREGWTVEEIADARTQIDEVAKKAADLAKQTQDQVRASGGNPAKPKESPNSPPTAPDPANPNP